MNKNKSKKIATDRSKAREIVNEILNFGVNEDQKMHILYLIAINLESVEAMKDITNFLKKYQVSINTDKEDSTIKLSDSKKIILT